MEPFEIRTRFPTPQDFFEFAEQFSNRIAERDGIRWWRGLFTEPKRQPRLDSNTPPLTIYFGASVGQNVFEDWSNEADKGVGKIIAQLGPDDTTILFISTRSDDVWKKVKPHWDLLYAEMERQGWLGIPQAAQHEPATMRAQSPTPTDAAKAPKLTTDQKIALALLVFAILTCIATALVVPQVQEVIQLFVHGAIPTFTPTLAPPTVTP